MAVSRGESFRIERKPCRPSWISEEEIFSTALQAGDPEERRAYLEAACGGDLELRRHVIELLDAHEKSGNFLDREPPNAAELEERAGEQPGDLIGPFRLIEKIGEGGFGLIYKAEQLRPLRRVVALKIIKLGMDTRQVVARFEAERQALALMDHPNIAKVFDAGATPSGRPFFIMELVNGILITEYCDREQLRTRQRLELFARVCRAVEHAHQKGIIHRDLKPSNILVSKEGIEAIPKVIDFGIAKALEEQLTDKALVTRVHQMVGTPAYMSPEQASLGNRDVDTRADIYSLGVLLYELLTGQTPIPSAELDESNLRGLTRTVEGVDPLRPSSRFSRLTSDEQTSVAERRSSLPDRLRRQLRGELDWIVMKGLEKDRTRRYQSASGFAEDVSRFLNAEPVSAGAPGALYRLRKLIQRNKAACLTATLFALLLLAASGVSAWLAWRASDAEDRAGALFESEREARLQATEELWRSYLSRARVGRFSRRIGQRTEGLDAIARAARIRPSIELRNEAIACLALPDLKLAGSWSIPNLSNDFRFADPARRIIASNESDGTVRLFSLDENREVLVLPGEGIHAHNLRFGPEGRHLSVHYQHWEQRRPLKVWNLETKEPVLELSGVVTSQAVDFAPGDPAPLVAVGHTDRTVVIHDLASKEKMATVRVPFPVYRMRFSPDGTRLAVWGSAPSKIQIWDWRRTQVVEEVSSSTHVFDLAWSPDGDRLATAGADYRVAVWDWRAGTKVLSLTGHRGEVVEIRFDPSGRVLLSASWDGTVRLWDSRAGIELLVAPANTRMVGPGGAFLSRDGENLNLFEIATSGQLALVHDPPFSGKDTDPVFSPDGELLFSPSPNGIRYWSTRDRRSLGRLPAPLARAVFFDAGRQGMWTVGVDGFQHWAMEVDERAREPARRYRFGPPAACFPGRRFNSGVLTPDGTTLICSERGRVVLFSAEDGSELRSLPGQSGLAGLKIDPSGRWLAGSSWQGRGVRIWDLETFDVAANLLEDHSSVRAFFSPDGKTLVTGAGDAYRFWEVGTWVQKFQIPRQGTGKSPGIVAFSPDARYVALADTNFTALLVELATGQPVASFEPPALIAITGMDYSPDARFLAIGTAARTIQIWDLVGIRKELARWDLDWAEPGKTAGDARRVK